MQTPPKRHELRFRQRKIFRNLAATPEALFFVDVAALRIFSGGSEKGAVTGGFLTARRKGGFQSK